MVDLIYCSTYNCEYLTRADRYGKSKGAYKCLHPEVTANKGSCFNIPGKQLQLIFKCPDKAKIDNDFLGRLYS